MTDHIPIAWRPYYSIQFPAKIIADLPISDRPAEALAILTRENHKEMSMKVIILFNILEIIIVLNLVLRTTNTMVSIRSKFTHKYRFWMVCIINRLFNINVVTSRLCA